jgi:hypothetical protein
VILRNTNYLLLPLLLGSAPVLSAESFFFECHAKHGMWVDFTGDSDADFKVKYPKRSDLAGTEFKARDGRASCFVANGGVLSLTTLGVNFNISVAAMEYEGWAKFQSRYAESEPAPEDGMARSHVRRIGEISLDLTECKIANHIIKRKFNNYFVLMPDDKAEGKAEKKAP